MSDFVKSVSKMSTGYDKIVARNRNVRIGVLGILILYCVLVVPMLTLENLRFLENNVVRIVLILVISLLCLLDPVVSIMLAICFVVTLHRLNVLRNVPVVVQAPLPEPVPEPVEEKKPCDRHGNNCLVNNSNGAINVSPNANLNSNDGVLNDSDLDINNNVVNNNVVSAVNNSANNAASVNNVANNAPLNNNVVNNTLLNNSVVVNNNNPNDLDYLNDNMNVLTNADNSAVNIVNVNDRHSRHLQNNVSGVVEVENAGVIGGNLLMDGVNGYNVDRNNKLKGPYRNNVMPNNSSSLTGGPFLAANNANNLNNARNNNNVDNFQVNAYNGNNLVTKNPFPGNNTNFQVEPQRAELNVPGFNHSEPEQLVINSNNNNNNVVEELTVDNNNAEGFQGSIHREGFLVPDVKEKFNDNNGLNSLNNLVILEANNLNLNNAGNANNLENVLNNSNQQLVGNNNQVAINNIVNNGGENNLENVPQNLLFTSPDQLQSAQDRSVYCDGTKNNQPILSAEGSHSAQGYNLPGDVNGYNQYGAQAINYLCVSDKC